MNKICYVVTISITIKSFFIPQLKYLADNGYDVTVICSPDEELQALLGPTVRYVPIEIPRGISVSGMINAINNLTKFFKEETFDLVQYSTPNAGLCAAIAAKKANIKIRNVNGKPSVPFLNLAAPAGATITSLVSYIHSAVHLTKEVVYP